MGNGPEGKTPAGKKSRLKTAVQTRGDRAFNHSSSNGDRSRRMNGREIFLERERSQRELQNIATVTFILRPKRWIGTSQERAEEGFFQVKGTACAEAQRLESRMSWRNRHSRMVECRKQGGGQGLHHRVPSKPRLQDLKSLHLKSHWKPRLMLNY